MRQDMNQMISGVIDSIYTKTVPTKRGDASVYHAMIDGQDVNLGFKHEYSEGESVNIEVEHKYGGLQAIQGGKANGTTATPVVGATKSGASSRVASRVEYPVPKNTKGIAICRQNSGGHAARMVAALISTGAISGKEDALDTFLEYAYVITDFATGHREAKQAEAMQAYKED